MRPTKEQIEQGAVEQLRIWCAEMMGWKWWVTNGQWRTLLHPNQIILSTPAWACEEGDMAMPMVEIDTMGLPAFSTDIAAALSMMESMGQSYHRITFRRGHGWHVSFPGDLRTPPGSGATLPLAICRAALLWWIEQPETESV